MPRVKPDVPALNASIAALLPDPAANANRPEPSVREKLTPATPAAIALLPTPTTPTALFVVAVETPANAVGGAVLGVRLKVVVVEPLCVAARMNDCVAEVFPVNSPTGRLRGPTTFSVAAGVVVPMPTLPALVMRIHSFSVPLLVRNLITFPLVSEEKKNPVKSWPSRPLLVDPVTTNACV